MRLMDYIRLSFDQLRRRKVVTALCALGISIGCAAIIVAMSIGESAAQYSEVQMNRWFKIDEINVAPQANLSSGSEQGPGDSSAKKPADIDEKALLTEEKLKIIESLPHVKAAAPVEDIGYYQIKLANGTSTHVQVVATDLHTLEAFGHDMRLGSVSDLPQTAILSHGATFGFTDQEAMNELYKKREQNPFDEEIRQQIENIGRVPAQLYQQSIQLTYYDANTNRQSTSPPIRVAGVLKKSDSDTDDMAINKKVMYISLETHEWLKKQPGFRPAQPSDSPILSQSVGKHYANVTVKVEDQKYVEQLDKKIQQLRLNTQNNLQQKERMKEEFALMKTIALGIGLFILFIASISIVVAMTMSTYQRKRQIGIMKVLGANLSQIRNMFMIEATLIGLLGGLLGVMFSYWIIWGINGLVIASGEESSFLFIAPWIIPIGIFFAILTGILAGLYPAVSASRTDALTAIRRD